MIVPADIADYRLVRPRPPIRPPLRAGDKLIFFPRPEPERLPPPLILLTVAQARRFASFGRVPRDS